MAQIEDVARAAGVSTATVSRALRGLPHVSQATSERVRKVAAELGYVASPSAVSLASGRTRTIGLLTPRVNQWFFSNVIDGAERALRAEDFDALLYTFEIARGRKRRRVDPDVLRRRVDGILVVGLPLENEEVEALLALGYPLIFVGAGVPGQVTVRLDDERTAYEATRHLLALGHRQIGHITGAPGDSAPWTPPVDRRLGWIRAMTEAGLEASPDLEVNVHFDLEGGRDSTRLLLARRPDVTAIFAASDEMAMGAMMTARELGLRIPEDLSVIGIDGHDLGELVGLTTMAQSAQDQGTTAATLLLGLITGTPAPEQVIFPTELVVRTSTAPPRRHGRAGSPPGSGGGAVTRS